jgi:hypothetical protein
MDGRMDGRTEGRAGGRAGRETDRQIDRSANGTHEFNLYTFVSTIYKDFPKPASQTSHPRFLQHTVLLITV